MLPRLAGERARGRVDAKLEAARGRVEPRGHRREPGREARRVDDDRAAAGVALHLVRHGASRCVMVRHGAWHGVHHDSTPGSRAPPAPRRAVVTTCDDHVTVPSSRCRRREKGVSFCATSSHRDATPARREERRWQVGTLHGRFALWRGWSATRRTVTWSHVATVWRTLGVSLPRHPHTHTHTHTHTHAHTHTRARAPSSRCGAARTCQQSSMLTYS